MVLETVNGFESEISSKIPQNLSNLQIPLTVSYTIRKLNEAVAKLAFLHKFDDFGVGSRSLQIDISDWS